MYSFWDRLYYAYRVLREPALYPAIIRGRTGNGRGTSSYADWGSFYSRETRYAQLWALAQQQAYRDILGTSGERDTYGMSFGVRDLFGVAYQLGEFGTAHIQGGDLDIHAGDGVSAPSALPIIMDVEKPEVRDGIAELWKRNNWQIQKDIATRFGTRLGDVFLEVSDDADAKTIRQYVHLPSKVLWHDLSNEGNVEAYELQYYRPDPRYKAANERKDAPRPPDVLYNEIVRPSPDGIGYQWQTYLNGDLFAWPGNPGSEWIISDLPFAPLVKIQHCNIGLGWGMAEAHASLSHARECADLASCLTDWGRRALHAPFLMSGMQDPSKAGARAGGPAAPIPSFRPTVNYGDSQYGPWSQADRENQSRSSDNYLYEPNESAHAQSLLQPMPVDSLGAQIDRVRSKMVGDYPELSFERIRVSGDASAEAIREARKPAEAKVYARRVEYDAGSARAFKMALTYGGLRGYRHYEPFRVTDYLDGDLDFRIGPRPAFTPDPSEETADRLAKYMSMKAAIDAGLSQTIAMKEAGYSDKDIEDMKAEQAKEQASQLEIMQQRMDMAKVETMPTVGQ